MRHQKPRLDAILAQAAVATVRIECTTIDAARRLRYALARRRGPAGAIVLRVVGRHVVAEPTGEGIIQMEVT